MSEVLVFEKLHYNLPVIMVPLMVVHGTYITLEASFFNEYLRNDAGRCALCNADYFEEEETAAEGTALRLWHDTTLQLGVDDYYNSCPVCDGRPI